MLHRQIELMLQALLLTPQRVHHQALPFGKALPYDIIALPGASPGRVEILRPKLRPVAPLEHLRHVRADRQQRADADELFRRQVRRFQQVLDRRAP